MRINIIKDFRQQFDISRSQGKRPTCLAFASSDAHSYALKMKDHLSVEYLFYYSVQRTAKKDPEKGVLFPHISGAISLEGQPDEFGWPYMRDLPKGEWAPPTPVPAPLYHRVMKEFKPSIKAICDVLDLNTPVILSINISNSFMIVTNGIIHPTISKEPILNSHGLLVVGYGKIDSATYLLIRNSWGEKWGDKGYAWVHEGYLKPRLIDAAYLV